MSDFRERHSEEIAAIRLLSGEKLLAALGRLFDQSIDHGGVDEVQRFFRQLMQAASHQGRFDWQIKTFATLRTLYAGSRQYDALRETILWYFKWIAGRVSEYCDVPLDTVESIYEQMKTFYEEEHESLRPLWLIRFDAAALMGLTKDAAEYFERWNDTPAGKSEDCPACEANTVMMYHLRRDEVDEALAAAKPVIDGAMRCDTVPASTFSHLLVTLLQSGQLDLAERMRLFTKRQVRTWPSLLNGFADHVVFLSLSGRVTQARRSAILVLDRARKAMNPYDQLCAWRAGWTWATVLEASQVEKVRIPLSLKFAEEEFVSPAVVREQCRAKTRELAARFDARNGTARFGKATESLDTFHRLILEARDNDLK